MDSNNLGIINNLQFVMLAKLELVLDIEQIRLIFQVSGEITEESDTLKRHAGGDKKEQICNF